MMNKKNAVCVFVLIAALTALILVITVYNRAKINVSLVTEKIEAVLPPYTQGTAEMRYNSEMPMMSVDGNDYVGILEIPSKNIKLPVCSSWDEYKVRSVPCRYTGSIYGNLVIGGTNTSENFEFLNVLDKGEKIRFIDMTGNMYIYTVFSISHKNNFDLELTDNELVLFTYLNDVSKYVFVNCE